MHRLICALLGALCLLPGPAWAAAAQSLSNNLLLDTAHTVIGDGLSLATAPLHWDGRSWTLFAGVAAGTVGWMLIDEPIRKRFDQHPQEWDDTLSDNGNPLGSGKVLIPALLGTAGLGLVSDNKRLVGSAALALESATFATLITGTLKAATGRSRPGLEQGSQDWTGPRSGPNTRLSFPSGHTTGAFAVASVFASRYPDGLVPYLAYGLATTTGYARLERDKHWASDVWLGAAIGIWTGRSLVRRHAQNNANQPSAVRLQLLPLLSGGLLMMTVTTDPMRHHSHG